MTAEQVVYDVLLKEIGQPPPPPGKEPKEDGDNEGQNKIEQMHKDLTESTGEVRDAPEPDRG